MLPNVKNDQDFWRNFYGPNIGYVEEQYEIYKQDPNAVDATLKDLFDKYGAPKWMGPRTEDSQAVGEMTIDHVRKLTSAMKYVDAIRRFGHLEADVYAIGGPKGKSSLLNADTYNVTDEDLRNMPATWLWDKAPSDVENGLDVVNFLRRRYTGKISFEYDHVNNDEERNWLLDQIEMGKFEISLSDEEKKQLLDRVLHVEGFEQFLQKKFVGQKRFSVEGLESMIAVLDRIVKLSNKDHIENIVMGMAHRGRLSVLAHVLGKPIDKILSEFNLSGDKELMPSEGSAAINYGWTGDVKYHFGATKRVSNGGEFATNITLAHNPSHLEFVNPVVAGKTRAAQDDRSGKGYPKTDFNKALSVIIHGDAAFIGEGIVPETLNLSGLKGYRVGGTLHIIANNLIGYTTDQDESRSTRYASDLAKGYEIPIIRVNADDPIACVHAIQLAYDYSHTFKKDCLLDLVGYRRYGHNEMDEPRATQPTMYQEIDQHPTVTEIFGKQLISENVLDEQTILTMKENVESELEKIYESMTESEVVDVEEVNMPEELAENILDYETAVPLDELQKLNENLLKRPEGFKGFKRLNRVFNRREKLFEEGQKADWGEAEALAYASILKDGIPIRLTGQDTERGTFAHRHIVLYDSETGETYCPMHGLEDAKASFDIHNSPLSEAAVLGFEYGYSVYAPETLVIWEAQFGDFANAGQVIFDQFISAARAKWGDKSNMVLLLPHGYEGQGPEHSSARLERFLQMAGENNWIVAHVTSSAQLFHILRRQAAMRDKEEARPLVMMTPKSSLIRSQMIASSPEEFATGKFQPLMNQPNLKVSKKNATRLLIGSGKVMVDIEEAISKSDQKFGWLRALRVEQLYPFPLEELKKEIAQLPNLEEIVWVQEEPKNMGSWRFVLDYLKDVVKEGQELRYVGQPVRAATSVGEPNVHKMIQQTLISEALSPEKGGK